MDRKPDEYATAVEMMRALIKKDLERNKVELARLEAELPKLDAQIAAGTGDADKLKARADLVKRFIKGIKGLEAMGERPKFKPNSSHVQLASR